MMKRIAILGACVWLAGCGGHSSDSASGSNPATAAAAPVLTAEGAYGGTQTGSASTAFQMLVLENSEIWSIYGDDTVVGFHVNGFVQGSGVSSSGQLISGATKDFGATPMLAGSTSASYDTVAKTIAGTFAAAAQTVSFRGGPVAGSQYNYNTAASLVNIAGSWATFNLLGEPNALTIAADGAISAASGFGCRLRGTVAPRPSGKNVFDVTLAYGASPCAQPGQTATGIAISYPLSNGTSKLIIAATDASRSAGVALSGTR